MIHLHGPQISTQTSGIAVLGTMTTKPCWQHLLSITEHADTVEDDSHVRTFIPAADTARADNDTRRGSSHAPCSPLSSARACRPCAG